MKIAAIDLPLAASGSTRLDHLAFLQGRTLEEYDTVIWNPAGAFGALESRLERRSPDVLSAPASGDLLAIGRHWRQQFRQLLRRGGTIALLLPAPRSFGVHTLQEVIAYEPLEPLTALLPEPVSYAAGDAGAPQCRAGDPFRTFFGHIAGMLEPHARLENFPGIGILEDDAGAALAAYASLPPGRVLLLPALADTAVADPAQAQRFVEALRHCTERLGCITGIHNAAWMEDYRTAAERDLAGRQSELLRQIGALQEELGATQRSIEQLEFEKQLVGGEGSGVRLAIAELFRKKGAFVQQDWLEQGLLIVELERSLLVLKVHLPEDVPDAAYFAGLEQARGRIADYFNQPARLLLADCADNALAPAARPETAPAAAAAQRHGALYLQGLHLYGWLMQAGGPDPDGLVAALEQDANALRELLGKSAAASLVRAVTAAP